jgi:hypothetical protein
VARNPAIISPTLGRCQVPRKISTTRSVPTGSSRLIGRHPLVQTLRMPGTTPFTSAADHRPATALANEGGARRPERLLLSLGDCDRQPSCGIRPQRASARSPLRYSGQTSRTLPGIVSEARVWAGLVARFVAWCLPIAFPRVQDQIRVAGGTSPLARSCWIAAARLRRCSRRIPRRTGGALVNWMSR